MTPTDRERCGEYVLGLLEADARSAFERRLAAEPGLAAAVSRLGRQLQGLDDTAGPVASDPALWARIEAQLDTPVSAADDDGTPSTVPPPANDNLRWYRPAMAASVLVALAVGFFTGSMTRQPPDQPVVVAVLLNETNAQPGVIIEAFADDTVRLVPLESLAAPEDGIYQLWTLPDPDTGPVSLGTIDSTGILQLDGPDLPRPAPGQLYEITLEPEGGSPTGRPTGPILVKGFADAPI